MLHEKTSTVAEVGDEKTLPVPIPLPSHTLARVVKKHYQNFFRGVGVPLHKCPGHFSQEFIPIVREDIGIIKVLFKQHDVEKFVQQGKQLLGVRLVSVKKYLPLENALVAKG
jgi:hypothetical protein